jgi:excisionase family DNA binding protein
MSGPERWYSLEEIAEHLGVSKDTVHRWIRNREMPAHKVGRLWKFDVAEVNDWVKSGRATDGER